MAQEITFNAKAERYEVRVDGQLAAYTEYFVVGDAVVMPHTVTALGFRGQGLAAVVVRAALDDALARGLQVDATCSYVAGYIADHPEYQPLAAAANDSISRGTSEPAGQ